METGFGPEDRERCGAGPLTTPKRVETPAALTTDYAAPQRTSHMAIPSSRSPERTSRNGRLCCVEQLLPLADGLATSRDGPAGQRSAHRESATRDSNSAGGRAHLRARVTRERDSLEKQPQMRLCAPDCRRDRLDRQRRQAFEARNRSPRLFRPPEEAVARGEDHAAGRVVEVLEQLGRDPQVRTLFPWLS